MSTPLPEPDAAPVAADVAAALVAWRTAHPTATLAEIEHAVDQQLSAYRAALITAAATQAATTPPERPTCPACGQPLQRVGKRRRQVTTAHEGQVQFTESGYRCPACGTGVFPPQ